MRLTVTSHLTLDGVMQSNGAPEPQRNDGFEQGGWQVPYFDEDLVGLIGDWILAADAFLFGRRTYELFAAHWARINDPADAVAAQLNAMPKYVPSTDARAAGVGQLDVAARRSSRGGRGAQAPARERAAGVRQRRADSHADGARSGRRVPAADPSVVLGNGKHLFAAGTTPTALELVDMKTTRRGVAIHVYAPAGRPRYGAVGLTQEEDVVRSNTA
jgi:dihydrofolate reductase